MLVIATEVVEMVVPDSFMSTRHKLESSEMWEAQLRKLFHKTGL